MGGSLKVTLRVAGAGGVGCCLCCCVVMFFGVGFVCFCGVSWV